MESLAEINRLIGVAVENDLDGVELFRKFTPVRIRYIYNGIGPECWPDIFRARVTDVLALFAPAALIHDLRFELSDGERRAYNYANMEFRDNCIKLADARYPWYRPRRYAARRVARILYQCVSGAAGWRAWQDAYNKTQQEEEKNG